MKRYRKGEILTAKTVNQLIDATRANTPNEGVGVRILRGGSGGFTIHAPQPGRRSTASVPAKKHPWKVTLKTKDDVTTATIEEGKVFQEIYESAEITPSITNGPVVDGDFVILQHIDSVGGSSVSALITSSYEGVSTSGDTTSIIIAKIVADIDDKLTVQQVARNNFVITDLCKDGDLVKYLLAI